MALLDVARHEAKAARRDKVAAQKVAVAAELATAEAEDARQATSGLLPPLEAKVARLETKLEAKAIELRKLQPLASRKPAEALKPRQGFKRRQEARDRLAEALSQDDLRISDISNALKSEGKLALVFDTRVSVTAVTTVTAAAAYCTAAALADTARSLTLQEGWECRMAFVKELCATIGGVWNADLSVDLRDEFGLSERVMDGIRFSISHEIVSGRQQRSRVATTGRNTLVRTGLKADPAAKVALGGNLSLDFVRKMGTAARTDDRLSEAWRL